MNSRIFAVIAFIATLGIFFGYISPTWSGPISETKASIASDNSALAAAASFAAQQEKLAAIRDSIGTANLARLMTALPDSVNSIGLIIDISTLVSRSGLSLTGFDVATPSTASTVAGASSGGIPTGEQELYQSLEFSISTSGSYAALKTFLANIEKSERLLDVQDIAIKGSDTGVYTYTIKTRVYWLR